MPRLPLILCAIALLSAVVSGSLFVRIGNSKQLLEQRLSDATKRADHLDRVLAVANEQNGTLKAQLATAGNELELTQLKLATAESRAAQLTNDLAQVKNVLGVYELTARALADEVSALRRDLEDTRVTHAPPETVAAYQSTIAELERQLAAARSSALAPGMAGASTAVFSSRAAGRATILTVGPENAFVVLNFGSARGAQLGQKLTVSQGTAEIATVLISDVRAHFSVAQVLPDTVRGMLQKGDSAVLIR
jgi:hypothetical protein